MEFEGALMQIGRKAPKPTVVRIYEKLQRRERVLK